MFRWRTFFFAMLLLASLPIRLAGAVALQGDAISAANAPTTVVHRAMKAAHDGFATPTCLPCRQVGTRLGHTEHAAGQCCASASCCVGPAAASAISLPDFGTTGFHAARPVSDTAPIFLTGGIDRPPRQRLV